MAVYAAMSISGAVVGLVAGGLLTTYASWRWVLSVNVPAGALVALTALRVLAESGRRPAASGSAQPTPPRRRPAPATTRSHAISP
jgi:MFS family permease